MPSTAIADVRYLRRARLLPYVAVSILWFVLFLLASRIRTIEPIFLWIATQSLIAERLLGAAGSATYTLFFLTIYLLAGVAGWLLVERAGSNPGRVWRRAMLTWIGIQLVYCLIATALVQLGILYE